MGEMHYTEQEMINLLMAHTWYVSKDLKSLEDFFAIAKTPLAVSLMDSNTWQFKFVNGKFRDFYNLGDKALEDISYQGICNTIHPESMELFKKILARIRISDAIISGIFKIKGLETADDNYKFRFVTLKHCSQSNLLCGLAIGINNFYKLEEKIQSQSEIARYRKENFNKFLSLSEREKEILCLTMQGMSNKKTADQLYISIDTVKQHLKNVRSKTELQKILELLRFAQAFEIV